MNPILMQVLAEAEQKGLSMLLDAVTVVVKDVLGGKDISAAFTDLGDTLAEKQAVMLDHILSPK